MRIKDILRTDSLAGSRIIINNNFKNVENEFSGIDKFFKFEDGKRDGKRVALTSPYIVSDKIITNKIWGTSDSENQKFGIFDNGLLCACFDENGDLLIRKDSKCELNVRKALEQAMGTDTNIGNTDISSLVDEILNNRRFIDKLIELIEEYAPKSTTVPEPVQ